MKIKASKNAILNVLKFNNSIIDNTVSSPYIQGILIEAIDNKIYLTSTNSFISAKTIIEKGIQIIEEGKLLVKSKIFFNIISKLKNEEIIIEKVDNSVLKIKTESFDSNINIMDEQQYPNINFDYVNWNEILLPPIAFKSAITKIMQSVSQNREKMSILNGICFNGENGKLDIYASDGYKLSFLSFEYKGQNFKITIDQNIFHILNEVIGFNENIKVYISDNNIMFKLDNIILSTKIMDADYPNITNIMKNPKDNMIVVKRKELIDAIERGIVLSMVEKKPIVKLGINKEELSISFRSYELGNSEEKIKLESFSGEDMTISLNATFLLSLLKVYNNDDITIYTSTQEKPVILEDKKEQNFIQLLLPIRNN